MTEVKYTDNSLYFDGREYLKVIDVSPYSLSLEFILIEGDTIEFELKKGASFEDTLRYDVLEVFFNYAKEDFREFLENPEPDDDYSNHFKNVKFNYWLIKNFINEFGFAYGLGFDDLYEAIKNG